ncbi:MAG: DUF885 domain-containing protein [Polyangiaceae bacterium]
MKASLTAVALVLGLSLSGCPSTGPSATEPAPDSHATTDAKSVVERLLDRYLAERPDICRANGFHERCDGKIADYSAAGIAAFRKFLEDGHAELSRIDRRQLDDDTALDVALLDLTFRGELFGLDELALPQRRPQYYADLFSLDAYLTRDYAPLDERVRALLRHANAALLAVPHVLENLRGPMPRAFVQTDLSIYEGYAEYLRGDVQTLVAGVTDADLRANASRAALRLADEADKIARHLKEVELPRADESHVLGVALYKKLLSTQEAIDDANLEELSRMADEDLERNKSAYEALVAKGVTPKRPEASALLATAQGLVDDAKRFIEEKHLMRVPAGGKLIVQETPPFMRWNSAFMNGPGPFDDPKLPAYYYITLPDPKWSAEEQRDYIMPFGTLVATTVHEVFPGHFLQGLWIREAPTRAQAILGAYSFVEGWAHYSEQLMVDEGFKADDPATRLGQLADALLRNCRFVVSIALHTKGMTLEEAATRFERDCKQDKATAKQQAFRGAFDPGYFAYTLGKLQILKLREEARAALGKDFSLERFHAELLKHGSPPVPLIRERVLRDLGVK